MYIFLSIIIQENNYTLLHFSCLIAHTPEFWVGLVAITTSLFSLISTERTIGSASMAAKTSLCNQPNRSTSLLSDCMH